MMHIAIQTTKSLQEINDILVKHGFKDFFNSNYHHRSNCIYIVNYLEPLESPRKLDSFEEEEIIKYLVNELGIDSAYEFEKKLDKLNLH